MRRGELLAVRWEDLDLDGATVKIKRSLEETKAGLRFKTPKTKHGRRTISLPQSSVDALRIHWRKQLEIKDGTRAGEARAHLGRFQYPRGSTSFAE